MNIMKLLSEVFKRVLLPACFFFTVLCFVFSAILSLSDTSMALPTINLKNICQIFVFSLVLAASNLLFSSKKIKYGLALLLHFICFIADISIVFFLIGKHFESSKNALSILFVFALVYIMIAAIATTVRHFILAGKNTQKTYKRQFR